MGRIRGSVPSAVGLPASPPLSGAMRTVTSILVVCPLRESAI